MDDEGLFKDWDLIDTPNLLAQKTIPLHSKANGNINFAGKTNLHLKPCTGLVNTATDSCTGD
jgi:hypothetical protein